MSAVLPRFIHQSRQTFIKFLASSGGLTKNASARPPFTARRSVEGPEARGALRLLSRDGFEYDEGSMLRTVGSLCLWLAALGLIGDIALHAQDLASSTLMAMAAASAVAVLG
jgi:hypothetical protein